MFSGCTVPSHCKETIIGSKDHKASPSACKNTGLVLVLFCAWKCAPKAISGGVDISELPGCHYDRSVLSESHKIYFKDWCLMNSQSTSPMFTCFLTQ